jgi:hypothetical protein
LGILISVYDPYSVIARLRKAVYAFCPSFARFVLHNHDHHKGHKRLIADAKTQENSA